MVNTHVSTVPAPSKHHTKRGHSKPYSATLEFSGCPAHPDSRKTPQGECWACQVIRLTKLMGLSQK